MLIPLKELDDTQINTLRTQLEEQYTNPIVLQAFAAHHMVESWLVDNPFNITALPSYQDMTFVSIHEGIIHGVFQAHITQDEDYIISCQDTAVINLGSKIRFGRDQREFYDFLVNFCHRIEVSGLYNPNQSNSLERIGSTARHFERYGARRIGDRYFIAKNGNGDYWHQVAWEILTPKGKLRFNVT